MVISRGTCLNALGCWRLTDLYVQQDDPQPPLIPAGSILPVSETRYRVVPQARALRRVAPRITAYPRTNISTSKNFRQQNLDWMLDE